MITRHWVVGMLAAGVLATACSGGDDDGGASTGGAATRGGSGGSTGGSQNQQGGTATGGEAPSETGGDGPSSTGGVSSQGGEPGTGGSGNPCASCDSGACLSATECVECTADEHCKDSAKPACDTDAHVCVECLPTADTCPSGSYCTSDFTCTSGCKDDDSCASGSCSAAHDCAQCVSDSECADGRVCSTGTCMETCSSDDDCGSNSCCSDHCVDLGGSVEHCGACGTACAASEFCGQNGCAEAVLSNVCEYAKAVALLDGLTTDDPATRALVKTLADGCSTPLTQREVNQTVRDVINPSTGRLLTPGGELIVAAGGNFGQKLVDFVATEQIAPVFDALQGDNIELRLHGTGQPLIVSVPHAAITDTHDVFVVELVRDPVTGSAALIAFGLGSPGTDAAVWYFTNVMFPDRANLTSNWYVYEWTDSDGTPGPSADDDFVRHTEP
jgi:hypothetical protein